MKRVLPFIPTAQSQDAPLSLLRRAAIENGYQRLLSLLHSLVPDIDHSNGMLGYVGRNQALFRHICDLIGIQASCSEKATYWRIGSARQDTVIWQDMEVAIHDLQFKEEKICIPCYLEKGYALSEWDHKAAVGCKKHQVHLDDHCPVCQTPWTFDQEPLSCRCNINQILRQLRPMPAEQASLLAEIVANQDQANIEKVSLILDLIKWWKLIGIELTKESEAAHIYRIFNGQTPVLNTVKTGEHLHPQVILMPILARSDGINQSLAGKLRSRITDNIQSTDLQTIEISRKEAQTLLGISRVRFDKFIDDGLIKATRKSRFPLNEINQLLLSSTWLPFDSAKQQLLHKSHSKDNSSLAHVVREELTDIPTGKHNIQENNGKNLRGYLTIPEAAKRLKTNTESIRYLIKAGKLPAKKGTPKSPVQWAINLKDFDTFNQQHVFASAIAKEMSLPITTTSSRLISAGFNPVSGPNIDGGRTFIFLSDDIKGRKLRDILQGHYQSPAGRKSKSQQIKEDKCLTSKELAALLQIDTHQIRKVVRDGWITGEKNSQGNYRFDSSVAHQLVQHIDQQYIGLDIASIKLDMSTRSFRYIWISSGYVREYSLGKRGFITQDDFKKISSLWSKHATSAYIGKMIGRHRSFCINLEKMGLLKPVKSLGRLTTKIKLFPREHPLYQCYKK